jgi:pentatricopeptide repeat protein
MIDGFCKLGKTKEASKLLNEMTEKGILPDAVTYNAFTNGLCKEGKVEEAFKVCDEMSSGAVCLDEITYTTLIDGCHQPSTATNQE